jgi:hypothetical protein
VKSGRIRPGIGWVRDGGSADEEIDGGGWKPVEIDRKSAVLADKSTGKSVSRFLQKLGHVRVRARHGRPNSLESG